MALAATDCLEGSPVRLCWLVAAILIQGRLLANLLDGMVAVEGGKAGPVGALWNEVPDRIADIAILIGAGFAAGSLPLLGFAAALSAVFVAYIRALGGNLGAGEIFLGPQSKPQRMALLTGCAFISAAFPNYETSIGIEPSPLIMVTLALMIVGCLITACRRLARISQHLRSKAV